MDKKNLEETADTLHQLASEFRQVISLVEKGNLKYLSKDLRLAKIEKLEFNLKKLNAEIKVLGKEIRSVKSVKFTKNDIPKILDVVAYFGCHLDELLNPVDVEPSQDDADAFVEIKD